MNGILEVRRFLRDMCDVCVRLGPKLWRNSVFYGYALEEDPSLSHPSPSAAATRSKQARTEGERCMAGRRREKRIEANALRKWIAILYLS